MTTPQPEKVFAVTMMRDEEDIAAHVLYHLAKEGIDGIIIADNNSRDETRAHLELAKNRIEESSNCQVRITDDLTVGYQQSAKMTRLAGMAAVMGATWIIPFDADEIWYGPQPLGDIFRSSGANVLGATIHNHFRTAFDADDQNPFKSMVYRHPEAGHLPKVAYRFNPDLTIDPGNHSISRRGYIIPPDETILHIRHFPYRSFEHMLRKAINGAEAYKATDYPPHIGAHWREYGRIIETGGPSALREVWDRWFFFPAPVSAGLVYDPAPLHQWPEPCES